MPLLLLTAQANPPDSPILTAIITWAPVLFLIILWMWFMRRLGGKGGYRDYMRVSQEKLELIEQHLADIANSLRKIAESQSQK
jgi:ATP-dependent Zn protease